MPRTASFSTTSFLCLLAVVLVHTHPLSGQDGPTWRRDGGPTLAPLTIFHSTHAANLPTAETLERGELLFEISHRFEPALSDGADALWGLDGPVFLRLGLGVAVTDRLIATVTRSNLQDNYDLNLKIRLFEARGALPFMAALVGGVAYNGELPESIERTTQWYGQAVLNTGIGEKIALGVVPWILRDPDLEAAEVETTTGVGAYGQLYFGDQVSILAEWNATRGFSDFTHDAGTLALELETGGHFFKLMVTNSIRLNPTQFLAGADQPFEPDEWRFGFNVTRLLVF